MLRVWPPILNSQKVLRVDSPSTVASAFQSCGSDGGELNLVHSGIRPAQLSLTILLQDTQTVIIIVMIISGTNKEDLTN